MQRQQSVSWSSCQGEEKSAWESTYAFFGVAFLAGAFLTAAFLGATFFASEIGALDFVTRPDLVLPSTTGGLSSTAGAYELLAMT